MEEPTNSSLRTLWTRGFWILVLAGAFAEIILGDLLFRPGMRIAGSFAASMWSSLDDSVFTTAAQDPRPIGDLIWLGLLAATPVAFGAYFLFELIDTIRAKNEPPQSDRDLNTLRANLARIRRRKLRMETVAVFLAVVLWAGARLGFGILGDAVLVWTAFNQNLAICAPALTEEQEEEYVAMFRGMKNRSDYASIRQGLDVIAQSKKIRLNWLGTDED